jgi:hypothetical protein
MNYKRASFIGDGITDKFWLSENGDYAIKLLKDGFVVVSQALRKEDGGAVHQVWIGPEEVKVLLETGVFGSVEAIEAAT